MLWQKDPCYILLSYAHTLLQMFPTACNLYFIKGAHAFYLIICKSEAKRVKKEDAKHSITLRRVSL